MNNSSGAKKKVLVGSIIVGIISLGVIFISRKQPFQYNKENKPENQLPERSENSPLPEKSGECPYLTESNLTTTSDSKNKNYTEEKWVLAENYQEVVSTETKDKIKEIHWTENIQDLQDLVLQSKLS